jgi:hypothetical protein
MEMTHRIENAKVVAETEKAICVAADIFDEPTWIPQSQVHEDSEIWGEGQEGDLVVKLWWAEKQGWV